MHMLGKITVLHIDIAQLTIERLYITRGINMLKPNKIERIIEDIISGLPEGAKTLPHDIKQNVKISLQGVLSKLDVVTREEFDAQVAVLRRTREKLDAIEQSLSNNNNHAT